MRHEGNSGTMHRSPAYVTVPCASGCRLAFAFHEGGPAEPAKPRLLDRVHAAARLRHYSRRTEAAYVAWIRRYIFFHASNQAFSLFRARSRRNRSAAGRNPPRPAIGNLPLIGHGFQNPCDGMRNARLKRADAFSHAMIIVSSAMVSSS